MFAEPNLLDCGYDTVKLIVTAMNGER